MTSEELIYNKDMPSTSSKRNRNIATDTAWNRQPHAMPMCWSTTEGPQGQQTNMEGHFCQAGLITQLLKQLHHLNQTSSHHSQVVQNLLVLPFAKNIREIIFIPLFELSLGTAFNKKNPICNLPTRPVALFMVGWCVRQLFWTMLLLGMRCSSIPFGRGLTRFLIFVWCHETFGGSYVCSTLILLISKVNSSSLLIDILQSNVYTLIFVFLVISYWIFFERRGVILDKVTPNSTWKNEQTRISFINILKDWGTLSSGYYIVVSNIFSFFIFCLLIWCIFLTWTTRKEEL